MKIIFPLPPQGAGKERMSRLAEKTGGEHIATGDLVRRDKVGLLSFRKKIQDYDRGDLVPDETSSR